MADEMRISELSRRTGVPVATVKYYLRTGLLHPGRLTGATQALYNDSHVQRLRLVRALIEVAGLSHAKIVTILEAMQDTTGRLHTALAQVHDALSQGTVPDETPSVAWELVQSLGWRVDPDLPALRHLDQALHKAEEIGLSIDAPHLRTYAVAASQIAWADVSTVPTESLEEAATNVTLVTVMLEPVLLLLRRLAQHDASARIFGEDLPGTPAPASARPAAAPAAQPVQPPQAPPGAYERQLGLPAGAASRGPQRPYGGRRTDNGL